MLAQGTFLLRAVFFAILTYLSLAGGIDGLRRDAQFGGTVEHAIGSIKSVGSTHGRRQTHWATYGYPSGTGQYEETTSAISPETFARLHPGDMVPIKFLPDRPETGRIDLPGEDEWNWLKDESRLMLGILLVGAGAFIIWLAIPQSKSSWEEAAMDLESKEKSR